MSQKIALLRGINVGGNKRMLMADVKTMFERLSFRQVITYIQSGNIIFEDLQNQSDIQLAEQIEQAIAQTFGFDVPVMIGSKEALDKAIQNNPYNTKNADINTLHLTFLKEKPTEENLNQIKTYNFAPDLYTITDKNVFIYCEGKYHQTKLSNTFFEKKLQTSATTRNWKTVLKLSELAQ